MTFDTVAVVLAAFLLGWGNAWFWAHRAGYREAERDATREREAAKRATAQWHQQPVVAPTSTNGRARPHGVHSAPAPGREGQET